MTCPHDYQYFAATNENGWRCIHCQDKPGEPPGFSPELDRAKLEFKVFALLNELHNTDLVYISNGTMGDAIVAAVTARCRKEQRYDQYSILLMILDELTESHALYWSNVSEAVVSGKDARNRCYCGKLSTVSSSGGGKPTVYSCDDCCARLASLCDCSAWAWWCASTRGSWSIDAAINRASEVA